MRNRVGSLIHQPAEEIVVMSQVEPFHTDATSDDYHPRERYVYHNQSECGYGQRVKRDGNALAGRGTDPNGNLRDLCDRCRNLA